jgi:tetratricopeptide (TPR) repeat protein
MLSVRTFFKHFFLLSLVALASVMLFSACVTTRKKGEAKGLKLWYQNLTGKYNGYFNANVLLDESIDLLNEQHVDNYTKILEIYPYTVVDNPKAAAPSLDKAIEKVAVVGTIHRVSHWTDDSYLLMGKSQFLKQEYETAQETLEYLTEMYNPYQRPKVSRAQNRAEIQRMKEEDRLEKAKTKEEQKKAAAADKAALQKEIAAEKAAIAADRAAAQKEREDKNKARQQANEQKNKDRVKANAQKAKDQKKATEQKNKDRKATAAERAKMLKENRKNGIKTPPPAPKTDETPKPKSETAVPKETATPKPTPEVSDTAKTPKPRPRRTTPSRPSMVKTGSNGTPVFKADDKPDNDPAKPIGTPKNYLFRHRPCYQEGFVWLARAYTMRKQYGDAESVLNQLDRDGKTFYDIRAMALVARAELELHRENYEAALPLLEKALVTKHIARADKLRIAYIVGQLQQRAGNQERAYAAYKRVLKYTPTYEMEFNTRLNMIFTGKTPEDEAIKTLVKMSKDVKNKEYNDQIFFTLAQIELKEKKRDEAIAYLKQSLSYPSRNQQQKAEAYLQLARMYYETENYVSSKNYYDSTSTTLLQADVRYPEAKRFAENLVDIARQTEIVTLQDSLLRIAAMTDKERRALANKIKRARDAEAEKLRNAALVSANAPSANSKFGNTAFEAVSIDGAAASGRPAPSTFFAYNPESIRKGKREFDRRWGSDRKNEDNWNRAAKRANNNSFDDPKAVEAVTYSAGDATEKEALEILKDIPNTPETLLDANKKLEDALFTLGTLYHDKLKNDKKAVETLERLLTKYPKTTKEMQAFYYLYSAHTDLKNTTAAKRYYDLLQEKYPNSTYARILRDPTAGRDKASEATVAIYYDQTFTLFKKGKAKDAFERIGKIEQMFGLNNPLKAKFALLNALCIGNLQGRDAYIMALKEVIGKFVDTPEERRAKEMLRTIEAAARAVNVNNPNGGGSETINDETAYRIDDDAAHYVIVYLRSSENNGQVEEAKTAVSDYNTQFYRTDDLKISNVTLAIEPMEEQMILIRRFENKITAKRYLDAVTKNRRSFMPDHLKYEIYAITADNYRILLAQHSLEFYRTFYEKYYLK